LRIWRIEGHAIVSDNDCIADAAGRMPQSLKNEADWAYFQRHLDEASIVVTGRKGHDMHPNKPGRQRLVFTSVAGTDGFSRQGDVSYLEPARYDFHQAIQAIAPDSGIIAVTGGTAVFDWFAKRRLFTAFHLARASGVTLAKGRPLFSGDGPVEDRLASLGLIQESEQLLDARNGVFMRVFSGMPGLAR
jgi:dihydrofolate reductase